MILTQEWLKEYTEFSEEHKTLVWKKAPSNRVVVGKVVGTLPKDGYYRSGNNLVHRAVWLYYHGRLPIGDLDHINGIRTDNRIENLRETTRGLNTQNRKGAKGYTYHANRKKPWCAQLKVNYKRKFLGYYATEEEANEAYLEAKRLHHPFFVEDGV